MSLIKAMEQLTNQIQDVYMLAVKDYNKSAAFELSIIKARLQVEINRQMEWEEANK